VPKKKKEAKDTIFGKSFSQILFETIKGERLPRILGNFDLLSKEWKEILEQLPHLYETGYMGTITKIIHKNDVDKKTLEIWKEYGFEPKEEYFRVLYEYYTPLTRINLIFNILPEETETLSPEEAYYSGEETDEAYEIFQQIDDSDSILEEENY